MRRSSVSRVLFDVNVPRPASRLLIRHAVEFADQRGWRELTNGDLLSAAESDGFDVMLTADTNLRYQQNLAARRIAIVALSTNAWPIIRDNPDPMIRAIDAATAGSYQEVRFTRPSKRRRRGRSRSRSHRAAVRSQPDLRLFGQHQGPPSADRSGAGAWGSGSNGTQSSI
jgi:hypothetical protein